MFDLDVQKSQKIFELITSQIENKQPGDVDQKELSGMKALIRRTEARFAAQHCGVPRSNIYHLDLPFYETGKAIKKPLGEEDVKIVKALLQKV